MKILELALTAGPSSVAYQQLVRPLVQFGGQTQYWPASPPALSPPEWQADCLPLKITLCTYFPTQIWPDARIELFQGDGRWRSLLHTLRTLLATRSFDVVHIHTPQLALIFLAAAMCTRPSMLRRTALHLHGSYPTLSIRDRRLLLPALLLLGRVFCCSQASRQRLPWWARLLARHRLLAIPYGVDFERVDRMWIPKDWGIVDRTRDLQLVSVGKLCETKNHECVIRALAAAQSRDVQLTILGGGADWDRLHQLAQKLRVAERVHLLGQIAHDEVLRRLWQADAFVSMSRVEDLPLTVLEAMSCHCPVVLSDIPPHRELRGPRDDLIPLIAPHHVVGLARAIDDWTLMPLDVLRAWGADCRHHIERFYGMHQVLEQLLAQFQDIAPIRSPELLALARSTRRRFWQRRVA